MIKTFCQYSYGGYKTLYVEGRENEPLDKEVTSDETYGFPDEANLYFQFGGAKIVYRKLQDGHLALVVREIPSIHKDSDGRSLSCAVQFIGDAADRKTLDNMAVIIANDLVGFGAFFANLFSGRGGLHIKGDKLEEYIDDCSVKKVVISNAIQALLNMGSKKSGVFLFIPVSAMFGKDSDVTNRVCKELQFDIKDLKGVTVSLAKILKEQKTLIIQSPDPVESVSSPHISQETKRPIPQDTKENVESPSTESSVAQETKSHSTKETQSEQNQRIEPVNGRTISIDKIVPVSDTTNSESTATWEQLTRTLSLYKKMIIALGLLSIILFIVCLSTCSGGSNKSDNKNQNETEINQSTDDRL